MESRVILSQHMPRECGGGGGGIWWWCRGGAMRPQLALQSIADCRELSERSLKSPRRERLGQRSSRLRVVGGKGVQTTLGEVSRAKEVGLGVRCAHVTGVAAEGQDKETRQGCVVVCLVAEWCTRAL